MEQLLSVRCSATARYPRISEAFPQSRPDAKGGSQNGTRKFSSDLNVTALQALHWLCVTLTTKDGGVTVAASAALALVFCVVAFVLCQVRCFRPKPFFFVVCGLDYE